MILSLTTVEEHKCFYCNRINFLFSYEITKSYQYCHINLTFLFCLVCRAGNCGVSVISIFNVDTNKCEDKYLISLFRLFLQGNRNFCVNNVEHLILISNVGTFEDHCLIPQLKLSLQGITNMKYRRRILKSELLCCKIN